ncbi:hypothetical protein L9G15_25540, partial [Shewanella sp. A3A]|nr:hypothetical protein [Shewanella ferrihydritica]
MVAVAICLMAQNLCFGVAVADIMESLKEVLTESIASFLTCLQASLAASLISLSVAASTKQANTAKIQAKTKNLFIL